MATDPALDGYRVRYGGTTPNVQDSGFSDVHHLIVSLDRNDVARILVIIKSLTLDVLAEELGDKCTAAENRARVRAAALAVGIARFESWIAENGLPSDPLEVPLTTDDGAEEVRRVLSEKRCAYQDRNARDLYCVASVQGDPSLVLDDGVRKVARTTAIGCIWCDIPDDRSLCAHFSHPRVQYEQQKGRREVQKALCGKALGQAGAECRPGGQNCWERFVVVNAPVRALRSPLELAETFDFLDAVWQLAFKKGHLIDRLPQAESARLASSCASREDFESNLSAVDDIFKRMKVPDSVLSPQHGLKPDETFKRLEAAIQPKLDESSRARANTAIASLHCVNQIRVALQHGKPDGLARALAGLRLQLSSDWPALWDAVRVRLVEALSTVREELGRALP